MEKVKSIGIVVLFIMLIIMGLLNKCSENRINELKQVEGLYKTSQDSLEITRTALNEEHAKSEVLETENTGLFITLNIRDRNIMRLQNLVNKYEKENGKLNTALIISNETNIKLKDSIRNLIIGYTHDPETPDIIYPIYTRPLNEKWYSGQITMGLDTTDLDLKIKNEYDVTIGDEKISLFKKKTYANITNLNPDTETKVMKVYQKPPVKTKFIKNNTTGAIVGLIAGYLLFK